MKSKNELFVARVARDWSNWWMGCVMAGVAPEGAVHPRQAQRELREAGFLRAIGKNKGRVYVRR